MRRPVHVKVAESCVEAALGLHVTLRGGGPPRRFEQLRTVCGVAGRGLRRALEGAESAQERNRWATEAESRAAS